MLEQKLVRATTAKNLFLAKMSHEIRTPISAVAGYVDLIHNSDPSQHQKYLRNISTSVEHLLNLVNDILDISSIEENKINLAHKKFNILEILNSVISTLKFKSNINKIKVVTKIQANQSKYFVGDETRIKQIILNLVSNAVKFSNGKPIEVRISIGKSKYNEKKKISIMVKDQGCGVNTSNREKIYQAFSQLGSSESYFEGTGLGLAIVKELSQLMNGSVKIFSKEGHGTLVATAIHLEESDRINHQAPKFTVYDSSESKLLKNKTICIAEDQTFNREILKLMAQNEGAKVIAYEDGDDLIKAVKSNHLPAKIDCFFLDIHMPIMSGIETLSVLREFKEYEKTPAYFITADAVQDNLERYRSNAYNLSGIYLKPLKRQELIHCVNNSIELTLNDSSS
ncbi:ATP-binding protein [Vibrio sp. kj40-1]|uniref:histidine kinase n=2 Tax=Vibrio algarum TaxID=3020714 RepID=A0ABT4YWL6_9VIBR|nr:ATP-binding protein [Vibrio sp. KJ40-1]